MSRTASLIGASGLIGSHVLKILMEDPSYTVVKAIVRRPLQDIINSKVQQIIIDFEDQVAFENAISGSDAIFSCIGTTNKNVKGDKQLYRKIDYDIPVNAAKAAVKQGVQSFAIVSSVSADATNNNNFYIKLKGVIEEAIIKEGIPQTIIMRPSLLLGNRKESRPLEKVIQIIMPLFSFLMLGSLKKYKPIQAGKVAAAMVNAVADNIKGVRICEYENIMKLAGKT